MARTLAVSVKRLDGWEPTEVTAYEYDETGRLARSVTTRGVEWDEVERGWLLALDLYEAGLCKRCGVPLAESLDADHDPDNPDAPYHYVADQPAACNHCLVLVRSERAWSKLREADAPALIHTARLVKRKVRDPSRKKGQVIRRADGIGETATDGGRLDGAPGAGDGGNKEVRARLDGGSEGVRRRNRQGRPR